MSAVLDVNVNPRGAVSGAAEAGSALDRLKAKAIGVENSMISVGRTSNRMGAAFAAITASFAVGGILRASDAYTVVNNRLKLVTASQEELAVAYKKVYNLAQETRAPLEATGKFYAQLALNAKQLGLTSDQTMRITGTLNKVIALTGQSAEASSNAIIQLQQALGSGALRGDELRSIMEQLPLLGQIIADSMGVAYGKLKELGQEGKITAKIVADALLASSEKIDKAFKNMTFTFGQAFTMLYNGFVNMIGQINNATGLFSSLAKGIAYVGYYMSEIVQVLGLFASALAVIRASQFIAWLSSATVVSTSFIGGMTRSVAVVSVFQARLILMSASLLAAKDAMLLFMVTNPFTALLAGLVLIVPLLYTFRDSIVLSRDGTVTLGTVFATAFEYLKAALPLVLALFQSFAATIYDIVLAVGSIFIPIWKAVQTTFDALRPAFEAIIIALFGTKEGISSIAVAVGVLIAIFFPWTAAIYGAITALQILDPGLTKTTFALTLVGEVIGVLIKVALTPLVAAFAIVIDIMAAFGVVSEEVKNKVDAQATAFIKNAFSLDGMTERVQVAYSEMEKQEKAIAKSGESTDSWSKLLDTKLNPALAATAESSSKAATAVESTATSTGTLNTNLSKTATVQPTVTTEITKGGNAAAVAANQVKDLAAAYRELAASKNAGQATSTSKGKSYAGEYATGGRIAAGKYGLVGENGPELINGPARITPLSTSSAVDATQNASSSSSSQSIERSITRIADGTVSAMKTASSSMTVVANASKAIATTVAKAKVVDYKESSLVQKVKYEATATDKALPGDPGYKQRINTTSSQGLWGGVASSQYDANKPLDGAVAAMTNAVFLGKASQDQLSALIGKQTALIQKLKDVRDTTASFSAFTKTLPELMKTAPVIDFQTAAPKGPVHYSNPYNLGAEPSSPNANSVQPRIGSKGSANGQGSSDKPAPTVTMNVFTPNAQSFRENRAQVEGGLLSMVQRAQRRAGR